MRKILTTILTAAVALAATAAPTSRTNLHSGWKVQSSARAGTDGSKLGDLSEWYDATVPSTAMGVLCENGVYGPELLEGLNYKTIDRTQFDVPWWWTTTFEVPVPSEGDRVLLELDGITYRADVWVNGKLVAPAKDIYGTFRRHSIDITPYAGKDNTLALLVYRAQGGEPNMGFVDWNPRPADENLGVFRPVWVHVVSGGVQLSDPAVKSKVNTSTLDEAWLTVEATLKNTSGKTVDGNLVARFDGRTLRRSVSLAPGETHTISVSASDDEALHIRNPRLWWTHNLGTPEMYSMDLSFEADGKTTDRTNVKFGIREIEDYFTDDQQRGFRLNGKPVLVRSAGWTDDIFLRNDSARNETEASYVRDMNLNSIRFENVWGTSEHIYDLCDSLGLLAFTGWSCQWEWPQYLGSPCDKFGGISTPEDMDLVAESLGHQVAWLRNHPSIAGWFVGSDMLPRPELEERYIKVLSKLDNRPCITAAKQKISDLSGPSGTKMLGPYEYVAPNYWYDPNAKGGAWGWNTETCIGAQFPQKESILRMIPDDQLWPAGEAWSYHCTGAEGMNSLKVIDGVIEGRYGGASSFDDYMRKAEWINYDGTRTMFEAFRARIPRATGIVQWMLNSAWPSLYWQLYDHYLVPTSAYYSLRHSNAPVQLIYDYGKRAVVAVNESAGTVKATASMERHAASGNGHGIIDSKEIIIEPYSVVDVFQVEDPAELQFVFLSLDSPTGKSISENFYVLSPEQDESDWEHGDWYIMPVKKHADYTGLSKLPEAVVKTSVERHGDTVYVTLQNRSDGVAFFNRLAAKDKDGRLIAPALWSDNYFSLRPGQKKTVICRLSNPAEAHSATITLDGWNTKSKTL